jgi:hypothetical protein
MNELLMYILKSMKETEKGELENYPDPAEPTLGVPLTQPEIDTLKKLVKELTRFDEA